MLDISTQVKFSAFHELSMLSKTVQLSFEHSKTFKKTHSIPCPMLQEMRLALKEVEGISTSALRLKVSQANGWSVMNILNLRLLYFLCCVSISRSRSGCLKFNKLDGVPVYIIEYVYWFRIKHTWSNVCFLFWFFFILILNPMNFFNCNFFFLYLIFFQVLAVVTLRDQKHREIHLRVLYSIKNVIKYNIFDSWYL